MRSTYFTTMTVNNWVSTFQMFPQLNTVILDSFSFLTNEGLVVIYAFVIMEDHIHVVWQINKAPISEITTRFKRYTGNSIIRILKQRDKDFLHQNFTSGRQDRLFKFWKINSNNFLLQHPAIIEQKINYTHNNPTKGKYQIVNEPSQYIYSSARSYIAKKPLFSFLKLWY